MTTTATKNPLTPPQERFAELVARGTGLNLVTVRGWVLAEGGPAGNPLNIGPGRDYGTPEAAAVATVRLLRDNKSYAPILQSAGSDVTAQATAIAQSPWDAGHYTAGQSVPWGTTLLGAIRRVTGLLAPPSGGAGGFTGAVKGAPRDLWDWSKKPLVDVGSPGEWVTQATTWAENKAVLGTAYVALTIAATVLLVMGLRDVFGPALLSGLPFPPIARGAGKAAGGEIPF